MATADTHPGSLATADAVHLQALFTFSILAAYVTMGRSRIYGLIDEGKFPPPIKIGRSSRWLKSEVDYWIHSQVLARQSNLTAG
jgi:predicted DNA-binding transcriptional regulator AlpA